MWIASSGWATAVIGSSKLTTRPIRYTPAVCACRAVPSALKYAPRGAVLARERGRALDERDVAALVLQVDLDRVQAVALQGEVLLELARERHQRAGDVHAADLLRQRRAERRSRARPTPPARARSRRPRPSRRASRVEPEERRGARAAASTASAVRRRRRTWRRLRLPALPTERRRRRYPRRLPRGSRIVARRIASVVLSDATIARCLAEGRIEIDPYDASLLQPSSVDVRVDRVLPGLPQQPLSVHRRQGRAGGADGARRGRRRASVRAPPGEFVLGSTLERIRLPDDLVARLEGKSSSAASACSSTRPPASSTRAGTGT